MLGRDTRVNRVRVSLWTHRGTHRPTEGPTEGPTDPQRDPQRDEAMCTLGEEGRIKEGRKYVLLREGERGGERGGWGQVIKNIRER